NRGARPVLPKSGVTTAEAIGCRHRHRLGRGLLLAHNLGSVTLATQISSNGLCPSLVVITLEKPPQPVFWTVTPVNQPFAVRVAPLGMRIDGVGEPGIGGQLATETEAGGYPEVGSLAIVP